MLRAIHLYRKKCITLEKLRKKRVQRLDPVCRKAFRFSRCCFKLCESHSIPLNTYVSIFRSLKHFPLKYISGKHTRTPNLIRHTHKQTHREREHAQAHNVRVMVSICFEASVSTISIRNIEDGTASTKFWEIAFQRNCIHLNFSRKPHVWRLNGGKSWQRLYFTAQFSLYFTKKNEDDIWIANYSVSESFHFSFVT